MTDVILGNGIEDCLALFHVLCRKEGMLVCFDGSRGKIGIYQKDSSRYRELMRLHRVFSIFDPARDGWDSEKHATRWLMAATLLSEEMKDRGIQVRILSNDFCVFVKVAEDVHAPFSEILQLVIENRVSVSYAASRCGMSEELFVRMAEDAGVSFDEEVSTVAEEDGRPSS